MSEIIVGVDVDDVCAGLLPAWVAKWNKYNPTKPLSLDDFTSWNVEHLFPAPGDARKFYDILNDIFLYRDVAPKPGALEGVQLLRSHGFRVLFVSACVPGSEGIKERWLVEHGFLDRPTKSSTGITYHHPDFIPVREKGLLAGRVKYMIDDGPHNLPDFENPYLVDMPHNRHDDRFTRVESLLDAARKIVT